MSENNIQKIIGEGTLSKLPALLKKYDFKNILLVRSKNAYKGKTRDLIEELNETYNIKHISEFDKNPNLEDVRKITLSVQEETQPDVVIALGGGSAIDLAKSISVSISLGYEKFNQAVISGSKIDQKIVPLIAIPTTAGTGSEATSFAVIYIDNVKYSLAGKAILPDFSIIDFMLSNDMPPKVTADCGLDALSQSIESYWSVRSTPESRLISLKAIDLVLANLESAVVNPSMKSRQAMVLASHYSGEAINITTTTAPHAVSYPLTIGLGLAHGNAVACTLAEFMVINTSSSNISSRLNPKLNVNEYRNNIELLFSSLGAKDGFSSAQVLYKLISKIGMHVNLNKQGFKSPPSEQFMNQINLQRLDNNPVVLDRSDIQYALTQPNYHS